MANSVEGDESGQTSPSGPSKYLILRAGDRFFAVPILEVREVLPRQEYVRLPGSGPAGCGLVSVRSHVLTVLDLGAALGSGRSGASPDHRVVVLENGGKAVGLAVSGVGEMVELESDARDGDGVRTQVEQRDSTGRTNGVGVQFKVIRVPELLAEWFG